MHDNSRKFDQIQNSEIIDCSVRNCCLFDEPCPELSDSESDNDMHAAALTMSDSGSDSSDKEGDADCRQKLYAHLLGMKDLRKKRKNIIKMNLLRMVNGSSMANERRLDLVPPKITVMI